MQGWSNYLNPTSNDTQYNVTVPNLPVNQLPANITDNTLLITTNPTSLEEDNDSATTPVFEEEIFTVDANGKVTMVYVTPATLCNIVAHTV
jgi:hypothetical protein